MIILLLKKLLKLIIIIIKLNKNKISPIIKILNKLAFKLDQLNFKTKK